MSRSNPTQNATNPCTRWFEWDGENGQIRYYDKEEKKQIALGNNFTFMVLDVLSVIKGWHDSSQSGITSNEIRDTRSDSFTVRSFKGGVIAEGLYADIKDRVNTAGGHFTSNCYIAYRDGVLKLGSIQFKGATLSSWMEFQKANRAVIFKKAVRINGFTEGKKGRITYRVPKFEIVEISEASALEAEAIDRDELQPYLEVYLKQNRSSAPKQEEEEPYNVDDAFNRAQAKFRAEREEFEAGEARTSGGMRAEPDMSDIDDDDVPF